MIVKLYKRNREIVNYLIVGALTTTVSLGTYYGCVSTFLNPQEPFELQGANILSWIAAVTFAYFTNRKFVFNSKRTDVKRELLTFYTSRVGTLFLDMAIMFFMVSLLVVNDKTAKIVVQVAVTIANYLISKFFVFRSGGLTS